MVTSCKGFKVFQQSIFCLRFCDVSKNMRQTERAESPDRPPTIRPNSYQTVVKYSTFRSSAFSLLQHTRRSPPLSPYYVPQLGLLFKLSRLHFVAGGGASCCVFALHRYFPANNINIEVNSECIKYVILGELVSMGWNIIQ